MASSGSFNTGNYQGRYLKFSWSVSSQSIANNKTTIKWSLTGAGNAVSSWYKAGNFKVTIDGNQVYYSSTRINLYNGTTVASGTYTFSHNNNGDKSFSAYAEAGIYSVAVNVSGSGSWSLPKIPRYATSNQSLSSKTETTIRMNWSSDSTVDYIWYSSNNGSSWTGINVADGKSGSYTINGLSANKTYNVKTRVRRKDSQLTTDSATLSVTTYAYPYCNSMPNFTIGDKLTLGFYNPLNREITVNIIGVDNSQISNDTTTGTSISGYNGETVKDRLYQSIPNSKSATYRVKVTYGSQINTKTGGTYTVNTSQCLPIIGTLSYQDTDSFCVGLTGNNQQIIRNQSKVKFTADGLTGNKGSTISSCKVLINTSTHNMTLSDSSATVNNITIDSANNVTATFTVTDSRGISSTKNLNVTMLDWDLPTATITCQRQSNFYSETDINVSASYSSINGANTVLIKARYKKISDSVYSEYVELQNNTTSQLILDNKFKWNVQVLITDKFGSTTYNLIVAIGIPIVFFDNNKLSTGFNCFPQYEESVEVSGFNIKKSIMTRSLSGAITDLAVNTYTIVPLNLDITMGDGLSTTDNGGIKIGQGINYVKVSAQLGYDKVYTDSSRHMRIIKNSYTSDNTLAWSWLYMTANSPEIITISPILAKVSEGDEIYIVYYTPNSTDTIGGNTYGCRTSLTVESVG